MLCWILQCILQSWGTIQFMFHNTDTQHSQHNFRLSSSYHNYSYIDFHPSNNPIYNYSGLLWCVSTQKGVNKNVKCIYLWLCFQKTLFPIDSTSSSFVSRDTTVGTPWAWCWCCRGAQLYSHELVYSWGTQRLSPQLWQFRILVTPVGGEVQWLVPNQQCTAILVHIKFVD